MPRMDWVEPFVARHSLPMGYANNVMACAEPLAALVKHTRASSGSPVIVGLNGAQGAGKTTFAGFLANWLRHELQLATACFSLDDVYLRKTERERLALEVHPLFRTRGVPGTHDVQLAQRLLDRLTDSDHAGAIALPAFDKARDERAPRKDWPIVDAPVDVVLFEGWCVGARAQPAKSLAGAVNTLEAGEDASGTWRRTVNERLKTDYADLFGRLDLLIMLRIPSFGKVFEWRALQERKLRERLPGEHSPPPGLAEARLARFIQHYERLTRHMLKTMPGYADAVIDVDEEHRMKGVTAKSGRERK